MHCSHNAACLLHCSDLGSLACYLSLLPQLHPNETIPQCPGGLRCALLPAKVAIHCRRFLGCYPHPSRVGKALGFRVVSFKAGDYGQGICLNSQYSVGPACDSLDHRAGACYLLHGLLYDVLHCAISMHSLLVPPLEF